MEDQNSSIRAQKSKNKKKGKKKLDSIKKLSFNYDIYPILKALNITDHIIQMSSKKMSYHPALFLTYTEPLSFGKDFLKTLSKELEKYMNEIDNKKIEHPNSDNKVWDLIHPSRYPFIKGVSRNFDDKIFKIPKDLISYNKLRRQHFYLSRHEMEESNYRWIPTIYHVSDSEEGEYDIEQKSYINDLFIEDLELKENLETVISKTFGVCFKLFEELYNNMTGESLKNIDLQVMVKSAYYVLKPGEKHEGVWHVEGMPDEHIIMTSIMYYQDDFKESILEMRRDVSEQEEEERLMLLPQNTEVDEKDKLLLQHLTYLHTNKYCAYAWPNSCQHRLLPLINKSKKDKKRSFIAFFLVDPNVKIPDTSMIKPQNEYIDEETVNTNMHNLMKERKKIKVKLDEKLMEEISYCEH